MSSLVGDILSREASSLGVDLSDEEIVALERYAVELKKWNSKINLTAITRDSEIAIKHLLDSLMVAPYVSGNDRLLDIGSGAGLPVIPLKIIRPGIAMVSVDAVAKKIHFQRHVIRMLNLTQIEALHARIETLHTSHASSFTVITSRAFTRLDRFVALAAPLLAEDGMLLAMKGGHVDGEIFESKDDLAATGFEITALHRYALPRGMGERMLTCLKRHKA